MTMKSFEDVFVIYYSAADYDPTFKFFTEHYHKIRTWSSRSPGFHKIINLSHPTLKNQTQTLFKSC